MNFSEIYKWLADNQNAIIRVFLLVAIGLPVIRLVARLLHSTISKRMSEQSGMLTSKVIVYGGNAIIILTILSELNFQLAPLLGAAGIAGVAIGFASKTSLSNLISGIFLIWEKPFQVNDVLDVGGTLGTVHSVDLLSVKLRTFDNKLVRIPNETLVQGTFTNITRFPIRRFDVTISVAYKEDIEHVTKVLQEIADNNPHSLDEPAPVIMFKSFGDSGLEFLFGVWFEKTNLQNLRSTIMKEIKIRFDAEGIEIPFPHLSLYTGSNTTPFPITLVDQSPGALPQTEPVTPDPPK